MKIVLFPLTFRRVAERQGGICCRLAPSTLPATADSSAASPLRNDTIFRKRCRFRKTRFDAFIERGKFEAKVIETRAHNLNPYKEIDHEIPEHLQAC